jgi:glutaredoxin-related protein
MWLNYSIPLASKANLRITIFGFMIEKVKKGIIAFAAIALVLVCGFLLLVTNKTQEKPETLSSTTQAAEEEKTSDSYEYFWSASCPHCANVEKFLSSWSNKDKLDLQKFEVSSSLSNSQNLVQRAQSCGIAQSQIGVPFLYTPNGECIIGDSPIIEFFNSLF